MLRILSHGVLHLVVLHLKALISLASRRLMIVSAFVSMAYVIRSRTSFICPRLLP